MTSGECECRKACEGTVHREQSQIAFRLPCTRANLESFYGRRESGLFLLNEVQCTSVEDGGRKGVAVFMARTQQTSLDRRLIEREISRPRPCGRGEPWGRHRHRRQRRAWVWRYSPGPPEALLSVSNCPKQRTRGRRPRTHLASSRSLRLSTAATALAASATARALVATVATFGGHAVLVCLEEWFGR